MSPRRDWPRSSRLPLPRNESFAEEWDDYIETGKYGNEISREFPYRQERPAPLGRHVPRPDNKEFGHQWDDYVKYGDEGKGVTKTFPYNHERPKPMRPASPDSNPEKSPYYHTNLKKNSDFDPEAVSFEPKRHRYHRRKSSGSSFDWAPRVHHKTGSSLYDYERPDHKR
ncbi:hypothetical protein VTL71DRAFT_2200 [Oculimacula yallundae]|uniref:Uncharacterized protein n=1 Tax=Oculimacula yallundae TaxID=86028 RepID=A0ABR4C886_9HELO